MGLPGGSDGKESTCNVGDLGSIPGLGRSPGGGQGNPLPYSCLENLMDRGAWQATVNGVAKSQTWLNTSTIQNQINYNVNRIIQNLRELRSHPLCFKYFCTHELLQSAPSTRQSEQVFLSSTLDRSRVWGLCIWFKLEDHAASQWKS